MIKKITRGILRGIGNIIFKKCFKIWQSLGFHITRNHFYNPIPDTRTLKDELWTKNSELVSVDMNDNKQFELLSIFASKYKSEYEKFPQNKTNLPYEYYISNPFFGSVDAVILYCAVRYFKPKKVFEVGSGISTYLSAKAIRKNKEENMHDCELTAIDPYPNDTVRAGFPGLSKLIRKGVREIPLSEFTELKENDILFIDSSHVSKIGSDVQYEFLEILPRLNKGVIVHFHDIFLPAEYSKKWVLGEHIFWNEQYLLQAFLAFNDTFEILWAGNYMHLKYPTKMGETFNMYKTDQRWSLSFWLRKTK